MPLNAEKANQLGENLGFLGDVNQSKITGTDGYEIRTHVQELDTDKFWRLVTELKDVHPETIILKRSGTGISIKVS